MEIVIEVDDVEGCHDRVVSSGHPILEPLQDRPWGLRDFRISDPARSSVEPSTAIVSPIAPRKVIEANRVVFLP